MVLLLKRIWNYIKNNQSNNMKLKVSDYARLEGITTAGIVQ